MKEECPICQVSLQQNPKTDDWDCSNCGRSWFVTTTEGEQTLQSRRRNVRLIKWPPLEGDNLNDIIKSA